MRQRTALILLACLACLACHAAQAAAQAENPVYVNWSSFKPGTSVLYRSTSLVGATRFDSTTTYTLVELTADKAVVEMQVTIETGGKRTANRPMRLDNPRAMRLPPGIKADRSGRTEGVTDQGEEVVNVGGKDYRSKWFKAKGKSDVGETFTHSWSSEEVPGGLVKSVNTTPAIRSSMTIELVEIKRP